MIRQKINIPNKILLIEDDLQIKSMYELKLKLEGFNVKTADNGIDGFKLVKSFKPDIVLLDMMMPDETGDQTLKKIRRTEFGKTLKVIMLSNLEYQDTAKYLEGLGVGPNRYIVKVNALPRDVAKVVKEELKAEF